MLRSAKLLLAFGMPAGAVIALQLHAPAESYRVAALNFLVNFPFIAAPQLVFFLSSMILRARPLVALGGLLMVDAWLVYFEWLLFHSDAQDSNGWFSYWTVSVPALFVGALIGYVIQGLTKRWSEPPPGARSHFRCLKHFQPDRPHLLGGG